MGFDPITLTMAKDYTDEKTGGGGGFTIPHFDLAAMGVGAVPIDGQAVITGDFSEIESAMKAGIITASFRFNNGNAEVDATGAFMCCYSNALGAVQGNATLYAAPPIRFILGVQAGALVLGCESE